MNFALIFILWSRINVNVLFITPGIKYQVAIKTGDDDNAGTESSVHVTLYGERGDTGKRIMRIQGQDKVVFDKDATQTFTLEAVSLGALSRCIVGHDGKEPGKMWCL